MSTFTPGPWLAGKKSSVVGWPVVSPAAGGRSVCQITFIANSKIDPSTAGDRAFNAESQANAHLIAAAPDLYEALNDVVVAAAEAMTLTSTKLNYTLIRASRALAKARGDVEPKHVAQTERSSDVGTKTP